MAGALAEIGIFDAPKEAPSLNPLSLREPMEVDSDGAGQVDDYLKFKKLEKQLEHLDVMEEYIKLETRNLEKELLHAQEEVTSKMWIFIHLNLGEAHSICAGCDWAILGSCRS
jgi:26S proteasome regulatory subunit T3